MSKIYWRCYPPFIDAYYEPPLFGENADAYQKKTKKEALHNFRETMSRIPSQWGHEALGRAMTREENISIKGHGFVFACGIFCFNGKAEKYVLAGKDPYAGLEFIKFDYPNSWDVT